MKPGSVAVPFAVDHLIKGHGPNPIIVHFTQRAVFLHNANVTISANGEDSATLPKGVRCLLFLHKRTDGGFAFLDSGIAVLDLSTPAVFDERVAATPFEQLKAELIATATQADEDNAMVALEALQSLDAIDSTNVPMLRSMSDRFKKAGSGNAVRARSIRAYVIAARLSVGDEMALEDAINAFREGSLSEGEASRIIMAIRLVNQPGLVHRLGALFWTSEPKIQGAAAYALANMKSRETFPYFQAGLKSPNLEVQYRSILGLAELARDAHPAVPGVALFHTNPSAYVQSWDNWCGKHVMEFGPALPAAIRAN